MYIDFGQFWFNLAIFGYIEKIIVGYTNIKLESIRRNRANVLFYIDHFYFYLDIVLVVQIYQYLSPFGYI